VSAQTAPHHRRAADRVGLSRGRQVDRGPDWRQLAVRTDVHPALDDLDAIEVAPSGSFIACPGKVGARSIEV
jgi:hypothetical protein